MAAPSPFLCQPIRVATLAIASFPQRRTRACALPAGRRRRECCPLLSSLVEVEVMRDGWGW
jgi:hypothetical protein